MVALSFERFELDLKLLKQSLIYISMAILLFIPVDYFLNSQNGKVELLSSSASAQTTPMTAPTFSTGGGSAFGGESLSSYESVFQKSVLFGLASSDGSLSVFKSSIAQLIKDYRLKGVVILDEPEAIVQDAKTQKNIFVKKGDKLGELNIKDIQEGFVIFSYYGETKEMRME